MALAPTSAPLVQGNLLTDIAPSPVASRTDSGAPLLDTSLLLLLGVIVSSIGLGFFLYGKKQ